MSDKHNQLEIFQHFSKTKKAKKATAGDSVQEIIKSRFPPQACLLIACSIIIIIVAFTLGVERGKVIPENKVITRRATDAKKHQITQETIKKEAKIQEPTFVNKKLEKTKKDAKLINSKYIIQLATYKKNSSYVKKEISKLKKKGYDPFVIVSGEYMVICTGNFNNKKMAQVQLKKLKRTYKDCFIKKTKI